MRVRTAVAVLADLRIETDGQRAHLVGDGTALVLHTDSPLQQFWSTINRAALPSGVGRVSGPRALGRAADVLTQAGITIDVTGPGGMIVRLGEGAGSVLGRVTTGSPAVQFGSVPVLASTLSAQVPVRRYGLAAAGALVLAALFALFVVLRRRR
jgi:hypothetical protein